MFDWVEGLIDDAVKPVRMLVSSVVARIVSLWATVATFLTLIKSRWMQLRASVIDWADSEIRQGLSVYVTLRWILTTALPDTVGATERRVVRWVAQLVDSAVAELSGVLDGVVRWAGAGIAATLRALGGLRAWALQEVSKLTMAVRQVVTHLFGNLGTPERLAEWAIGAIMRVGVKYVNENADLFARMLWQSRIRAALWAATRIESVISRII